MSKNKQSFSFISCFPELLYDKGGFRDDSLISLNELSAIGNPSPVLEWIEQVYPSYQRWRHDPECIMGLDETQIKSMSERHLAINQSASVGPACGLIHIPHAYLLDRVLYVPGNDSLDIIYETYRPNDRPAVALSDSQYAVMRPDRAMDTGTGPQIYLGSSGSFNYGHWLVDDLTRVQNTREIAATYVLPSFGERIDNVRRDFLSVLTTSPVVFVDNYKPIKLSNVLFVTPTSYHPVIKCPASLNFVRSAFSVLVSNEARYSSILVLRRDAKTRELVNQNEVIALAQRYGYSVVYPEELSFLDQVRVFSGASRVVGVMGAGMTNTMFCSPHTKLTYLTPVGWLEPFYWDLADALQHFYSVVFGRLTTPELPPHFSSFTIDLGQLQTLLEMQQ